MLNVKNKINFNGNRHLKREKETNVIIMRRGYRVYWKAV